VGCGACQSIGCGPAAAQSNGGLRSLDTWSCAWRQLGDCGTGPAPGGTALELVSVKATTEVANCHISFPALPNSHYVFRRPNFRHVPEHFRSVQTIRHSGVVFFRAVLMFRHVDRQISSQGSCMPSIGAAGVQQLLRRLYALPALLAGVQGKQSSSHAQPWGHKPEYTCCTAVMALH